MKLRALFLLASGVAWGGALDRVKAEPDLEKRSELALQHADRTLGDARKTYDAGKFEDTAAQIAEAREAVRLSIDSLRETNKNPRKKSKYFKRAEIKTRQLLKDLENFSQRMSLTDRQMLDGLRKELQQVNDELVKGVMGIK